MCGAGVQGADGHEAPAGAAGFHYMPRPGLVDSAADAELAVAVEAPAPQLVPAAGAGGVAAGGDLGPAGGGRGGDLLREVLAGLAANAQLAGAVPAPAPQSAIDADGAGVAIAGRDGRPAVGARGGDRLRGARAGAGPQAQLA